LDLRRLRAGEWLAGAGGIALIVALMLPWFDEESGYEALTVIDVLLALLALLAIALPVLQATRDSPALPIAAGVVTAALGIPGVLLVLFRVIDDPFAGADRDVGIWVALAATVAIEAAGWMSIDNEYVKGLPPDPEPELRPAPQP
jgi:hypothetical protein